MLGLKRGLYVEKISSAGAGDYFFGGKEIEYVCLPEFRILG